MSNETSGKIEYILQRYPDEAIEKITAMIESRDAHIKKLASIGSAQERELEWARNVLAKYEGIMQAQSDMIEEYKMEDIARGQGRTATFVELVSCHRHIPTERYEG